MTPAAVIGFWAAVMGGVLMYLVAGREVAEALREWLGPRADANKDAFEAERARLGRLATAFLGSGVDVAPGAGVTLERRSGRPLRLALPAEGGAVALRHLLLQAARVRCGGYEREERIADPGRLAEYRRVLDAGLLASLVHELPGAPWSEADRALAARGLQMRAGGGSGTLEPFAPSDVPWRCERVEPPARAAADSLELRPIEGVEQRDDLIAEAPRRLTHESEGERGGIFFIRFESIQEWTEDFLDLDRPSENDGSAEGKQNTGVRTRKATLSRRGSASTGAAAAAQGERGEVLLPEWDCTRGAYKPGYCRTLVRDGWVPEGEDPARALRERLAGEVRRLELALERLCFHRRNERRQPSGNEVDLDAWVRFRSDLAAGAACDATRLYRTRRPARREIVVGTLVDLSASTETPCGERRVVDLERDALYLLARAIDKLGDVHAAWGFTSQGAAQVHLFRLKGFDEPLRAAEPRLAGLGPYANTRMGAAIRRAVREMSARPGAGRLLFVLTDGKPHDDDGYAGAYALADTRRALEEARAAGVRVVGIGVGPDAAEGMPALFAPHFVSVERVEALPRTLSGLYVRLAGHGVRS